MIENIFCKNIYLIIAPTKKKNMNISSILWFSINLFIFVNGELHGEQNILEKSSETVQIKKNLLIPTLEFLDQKKIIKWGKSVNKNRSTKELILNNNNEKIRKTFYSLLSHPMQNVCAIPKRIGGLWLNSCKWFDGSKFVCLDHLKKAIEDGTCLIYSFGLGREWSFELLSLLDNAPIYLVGCIIQKRSLLQDTMARMGCTVRAFDPNVEGIPHYINPENIHFAKIGIDDVSSEFMIYEENNNATQVQVKSLEDSIKYFGDEGKTIHYLKVDVEGYELKAIPTWVSSGILKQIQQINLELHTGGRQLSAKEISPALTKLLMAFNEMDENFGFKIIDYMPNGCVSKKEDTVNQKYHSYFDIILMKK